MSDKPWVDLTKKEKLARAGKAERDADSVLKTSRNDKERAGAKKAKAAAGRVQKRLGGGPSSKDMTKPGKKGEEGLWDIAKRFLGIVGEEKKRLEGIEKDSRPRGK